MATRPVVFRNPGGRSKRPIDKALPCIVMAGLQAVQQTQDLVTPSAPCTVMGLRWEICMWSDVTSATADGEVAWAIIILRDGRTANTMSKTGGANLYEPEQDVLAFGREIVLQNANENGSKTKVVGNTKTMRKLKVGDKITFIALGTTNGQTEVRGTVQVFCKF